MPSSSAPSEAGALLQTLPLKGRGALFLQGMFGIVILVALRYLVMVSLVDVFAYMLLAIGIGGVVAVRSVARLQLEAVSLHEAGLVTHRQTGTGFIPFPALQEVRRDVGVDGVATYTLRLSEGQALRLELTGARGARPMQDFVDALTARAGLSWQGNQARR